MGKCGKGTGSFGTFGISMAAAAAAGGAIAGAADMATLSFFGRQGSMLAYIDIMYVS